MLEDVRVINLELVRLSRSATDDDDDDGNDDDDDGDKEHVTMITETEDVVIMICLNIQKVSWGLVSVGKILTSSRGSIGWEPP